MVKILEQKFRVKNFKTKLRSDSKVTLRYFKEEN